MSQKYRANIGLRSSQGIVRSIVIGCVFAAIVVALIAFTNLAASRMDVASASHTSTQSTPADFDSPNAAPGTELTPKTKLEAVQNTPASADKSSTTKAHQPSTACDTTIRKQIIASYTKLIQSENELHTEDVANIVKNYQKTSLLTRILNPGMTSSRLSAENSRHLQALKSLTQKETIALHNAHC